MLLANFAHSDYFVTVNCFEISFLLSTSGIVGKPSNRVSSTKVSQTKVWFIAVC